MPLGGPSSSPNGKEVLQSFCTASHALNDMKYKIASYRYFYFFSNEKIYTRAEYLHSTTVMTNDIEETPVVMCVKFPVSVMVLRVVSNEGDVPHIFQKDQKVDVNVLKNVLKPWMGGVARGGLTSRLRLPLPDPITPPRRRWLGCSTMSSIIGLQTFGLQTRQTQIPHFGALWSARPTPNSTPTSTPSGPPLWSSSPS